MEAAWQGCPEGRGNRYLQPTTHLDVPRGWDWVQWIAFERDHPEPTKEDQELADRVARMEEDTRRQRRWATLLYLELRLALVGTGLIILVVGLLAGRLAFAQLLLIAIGLSGGLALILLPVHRRLSRR
jgi:hypothetical protein